jgi:SAM-dependent methyltransferase
MQSFRKLTGRLAPSCIVAMFAPLFLVGNAPAATSSVPYVPTPRIVVDRMLEIGKVGPQDYLIDLGSGDGRIVVTAAKRHGARGFGVDLNPARIAEANSNARRAGVTDKVNFYQQDLFETDLSRATVITMYLLPRVNLALRPKLLELRPGTRIVSHDFSMDDWKPEHHEEVEAKDKYGGSGGRSDIYLWIVPAKVAGTWQSQVLVRGKPVPYEITFQQEFQNVSGSARVAGQSVKLQSAKLSGDALTFEFTADVQGTTVRHQFSGVVSGATLAGVADLAGPKLQSRTEWSAVRSPQSAATTGAAQTLPSTVSSPGAAR